MGPLFPGLARREWGIKAQACASDLRPTRRLSCLRPPPAHFRGSGEPPRFRIGGDSTRWRQWESALVPSESHGGCYKRWGCGYEVGSWKMRTLGSWHPPSRMAPLRTSGPSASVGENRSARRPCGRLRFPHDHGAARSGSSAPNGPPRRMSLVQHLVESCHASEYHAHRGDYACRKYSEEISSKARALRLYSV